MSHAPLAERSLAARRFLLVVATVLAAGLTAGAMVAFTSALV